MSHLILSVVLPPPHSPTPSFTPVTAAAGAGGGSHGINGDDDRRGEQQGQEEEEGEGEEEEEEEEVSGYIRLVHEPESLFLGPFARPPPQVVKRGREG